MHFVSYPFINILNSQMKMQTFCSPILSSSEAVDLALQLSALHTGGTDVLVTDNAFHGSIDSVHHLSPKVFKANNICESLFFLLMIIHVGYID